VIIEVARDGWRWAASGGDWLPRNEKVNFYNLMIKKKCEEMAKEI
jgi:hypothetical protein